MASTAPRSRPMSSRAASAYLRGCAHRRTTLSGAVRTSPPAPRSRRGGHHPARPHSSQHARACGAGGGSASPARQRRCRVRTRVYVDDARWTTSAWTCTGRSSCPTPLLPTWWTRAPPASPHSAEPDCPPSADARCAAMVHADSFGDDHRCAEDVLRGWLGAQ